MNKPYILGINAYHGDASAVLLEDGHLQVAVEEERLRRLKHWAGFPIEAIRTCLAYAGISGRDIGHVALSRNPRANLVRKALFTLTRRPDLKLIVDRLRNARTVRDIRHPLSAALGIPIDELPHVHHVEHHPAHLASAFFVSGFEEAAVAAIDGFGDFVSSSFGAGRGRRLEVYERVYFPHSLGLLYLAITQYLGFMRYGDEYKVMGLAPYGKPDYVDAIRRLVRLRPNGNFELDLAYFRHWSDGVSMTWDDGEPIIGQVYTNALERWLGPARRPDEPVEPRHEAIAASLQVVFEEAAVHCLTEVHRRTGMSRLCLAGGCGMNSVMNGKIRARTPFRDVYIQPAAADNGTALGAACYVAHHVLGHPREFVMDHGYWGPDATHVEIGTAIQKRRSELGRCVVEELDDDETVCQWAAQRLADGNVLGWFQGRMEWGARALGNRSILADPRRPDMRDIINTKIKFREKFRPFAPSILVEALDDYFVDAVPDPFMIQVYPVRPDKRGVIPAVTHVDGSGRLQTVSRQGNPLYWLLIKTFEKLTGVPVLLNTSFNENEPIVHRPEEALDCFVRTNMDALVVGRFAIAKRDAA